MGYRIIKRAFDLISSLVALIVLSPVFLVIAIGIKVSSKGPLLFKSERIGLNGKPFVMYKFRSMHVLQEGAVESAYLVNNSRIFKFGSFLRKSKLDELPQLVNVFLSDMSVVGPRPYPKSVVDWIYVGEYADVLGVKPGLACYDSLYDYAHGELWVADDEKYATEIIPVRTELAKMYVDKQSVGTDATIIGRTVKMIFAIVVRRQTEFGYNKEEQAAIESVNDKKAARAE